MNADNADFVPSRTVQALKNAVLRLYCGEDLSVIGKLGSGFFATVYLVYHHPTKLKMAMKVSDEGSVQRREIELLGSLRHENVQRLYGACVVGGRLACLTEYANGGSLVDLLTGSSRLPWISRTKIANDIASGVGYLHEHQLIHRDLSSQNILIRVNRISHGSAPLDAATPRSTDGERQGESPIEDFNLTSTEDNSTWLTIEQLIGYRRCSSLSPPPVTADAPTHQLATSCTVFSAGLDSLREPFSSSSLCKVTPLTARSLQLSPGGAESPDTGSPELASAYTAIVGDLGLCLDLRQKNVDRTITVGNPYFTAPECLKKRAPYSPAADVFSFGIILCELITCLVNDGLRIPRTPLFGLDVDSLPTPSDCPPWLLDLAVRCCNVEHTCRPLVKEINQILRHHLSTWSSGVNSSLPTPKTASVLDPTADRYVDPPCASPVKPRPVLAGDQIAVEVPPASVTSDASTSPLPPARCGSKLIKSTVAGPQPPHQPRSIGTGTAGNCATKSPAQPSCPSSSALSYEHLTIEWKIAGRAEPPHRLETIYSQESVHLSAAAAAAAAATPAPSSLLDRPTATFALPDGLA
ncbi:Dual specificity testis-specific protein kinase 2 [Sparganum proliferum]